MNRREALAMLAALPLAARLRAQTRATALLRFAVSLTHGLLLEADGRVKSWARSPGQPEESPALDALGLGHERPVDPHTLYAVPGLTGVTAVAVSPGKSYAVTAGRLLAWGASGSGELGITPRAEFEERAQPRMKTNTPMPLAVPFDAVDVSCKSDHVMALARDGSVYTWGRGDSGQLGIGPLPTVNFKTRSASVEPYVPYPVRVPELDGVTAISAGNTHSLALPPRGRLRARLGT
jgi:alpha-tubulin suppressor-like RCC1 family protein